MSITWIPEGKRNQGRPKQTRRQTMIKELENIWKTWGEPSDLEEQGSVKRYVGSPIPYEGQRELRS